MKDIPNVSQKDILAADKAKQRFLDNHSRDKGLCDSVRAELAVLLAEHGTFDEATRSFVIRQSSWMSNTKMCKFMLLVKKYSQ